ncbi:MAG: putative toxin-antitoxin system toxin component, PIN family [Bacillota bacterium]
MRIALDTNVLVSGLLKGHSAAGTIVRLVAGGLVQVVYDARILTEYREVLARPKFGFEQALVKAILIQIEEEGVLVSAAPLPERLPDPDDEPFLEVARATGAILVTGNKRHFPPVARGRVTVMSPAEFIKFWRETCNSR